MSSRRKMRLHSEPAELLLSLAQSSPIQAILQPLIENVAACEEVDALANSLGYGTITLRVQDGVVVRAELSQSYKVAREHTT